MSTTAIHRTRVLADAVISSYINEIAVPAERPAPARTSRAPKPQDCNEARTHAGSLLRIRRWAPRRRPALQLSI
jgi:hypothetical protein